MPQRSIRFQGERWFKCKEDKGIILPLTGKEPLGRLTWLHEVASVGEWELRVKTTGSNRQLSESLHAPVGWKATWISICSLHVTSCHIQ